MRALFCAVCAIAVSGCGTIIKDRGLEPRSPIGGFGQRVGSPAPKNGETSPADTITIDLVKLIGKYSPGAPPEPPGEIEAAIAGFDTSSNVTDTQRAVYRNEVVGAVLAASEKNCEVYIEYLHGNQVTIRAISSVLATACSGAASVTTPISNSKVLAALGAASTGIGGNLDDAAFSKYAVDAIVAGIRADQAQLLLNMTKQEGTDYKTWPLTFALRDAIQYHNHCDAISGLA